MGGRIEKDGRFLLAERYIQETGISVFLTGKAGTGKTTFLKHIVATTGKRFAVVAPTGVAAVNAGGVTIHSFFQLPLCPYLPDVKELVTEYQMSGKYRTLRKDRIKILRTLDLLVIDEVSMVRADIMDAMDATLRRYRRNNRPFGGVQLLMIGDIQQLPPVVTESEKPYMDQVYPSPFFFCSKAFRQLPHIVIELEKIHRQSDATFLGILNDIRSGHPRAESLKLLNSRLDRGFMPPEDEHWIRLTTHNYMADNVNRMKMDGLEGKPRTFKAVIDGNYPENSYPVEAELTLKKGAQVMFTRNDTSGDSRYYNGKIGTVKKLEPELIVTDEEGNDISVDTEKWDNVRYELDPADNEIKAVVDGSFTQIPLRAAWAITIHKSQGLTFDRVVIDAGHAFSFGQVYVALSRCRTLEGIVLSTPITANCTFTNEEVNVFESSYTPATQAESELDSHRRDFQVDMMCEMFNLWRLCSLGRQLEVIWTDNLAGLYPELESRMKSLMEGKVEGFSGTAELKGVSERFRKQIRRIGSEGGPDVSRLLSERTAKGAVYFHGQLMVFLGRIAAAALLEIDNQEVRKKFKSVNEELLKELIFRITLYGECSGSGFDMEIFNRLRTESAVENITMKGLVRKALSMTGTKKEQESREKAGTDEKPSGTCSHPEVLESLKQWRRQKCKDLGVPAFMVLHQKTMNEIADLLPQSKEELLSIKGFGKSKWDKYGDDILKVLGNRIIFEEP